jgi:hypothetical protein
MAVAWPQVVDYLLATLPNLPSWASVAVFDGPPNTGDDPTDYCTVGYVSDDSAGTFLQSWNDDGFHVNEEGTIRLDITAQTGDDTLSEVRTRAFVLFDELDDWLRRHQTLGGLLSTNATVLLASDGVNTESNAAGLAQTIVCSVGYYTETYTP